MFKEQFVPKHSEREKAKRVSQYAERLQTLNANQLYAEFLNQIDSHPTLRQHSTDLRKAYANMAIIHHGQTRRQSGLPYEVHPAAVALMLIKALDEKGIPIPDTAVKAALKHDTVEDGKHKGVTLHTIQEQSGHIVEKMVDALTKHDTEGNEIDDRNAAKKIRNADQTGVEFVRIIKILDNSANIYDQPKVSRPPIIEHVLFFTKKYRKSPYGRWQKMRWKAKLISKRIIANKDPFLEEILDDSVKTTEKKIKERRRQSIKNK